MFGTESQWEQKFAHRAAAKLDILTLLKRHPLFKKNINNYLLFMIGQEKSSKEASSEIRNCVVLDLVAAAAEVEETEAVGYGASRSCWQRLRDPRMVHL